MVLLVTVVLVAVQVVLVILEMLEQSAILEILEQMVTVVAVVVVVLQVVLVIQAHQETLEHQAVVVAAVVAAVVDLPPPKIIFIILDMYYPNLIMDKMVVQDKRVEIQEVVQVAQVALDHMLLAVAVMLIQTGHQVLLDNQEMQVVEATPVVLVQVQQQAVAVLADNQETLAQMVLLVIQVLLAMLVLEQLQVLADSQELLAQMA